MICFLYFDFVELLLLQTEEGELEEVASIVAQSDRTCFSIAQSSGALVIAFVSRFGTFISFDTIYILLGAELKEIFTLIN
jgi:hypothetical protein